MKRKEESKVKYIVLTVLTLITICIIFVGVKKDRDIVAQNEKYANKIENQDGINQDISSDLPIINCWGDSLTVGVGGDGITYPDELSNLSNMKVNNYAVKGASTNLLASIQGGISLYTDNLTIPGDKAAVEIDLYDKSGRQFILSKNENINPCKIGDIEGNITYDQSTKKMYFTRLAKGKAVEVKERTQLFTNAMLNKDNKQEEILVLFTGNEDNEDIGRIIENQKKMIDYAGTDKYIVIGITKDESFYNNQLLAKEYGNHFLNIKKYLLEHGLEDAKIEATKQDKLDIGSSIIPSSLKSDETNLNAAGYKIVAQQVLQKIIDLGYLSDAQIKNLGIKK